MAIARSQNCTGMNMDSEIIAAPQMSMAHIVWRRFRKHRIAVVGAAIVIIFILLALLAPVVSPYDPTYIDRTIVDNQYADPSWSHVLGTDELGRDILTRLIYAGRISLLVGFGSMAVSVLLGIIIGAFSGFYGGWLDAILMRFTDLMLSLPLLPLLLVISAMVGGGVWTIIVVLSVFGWMGVARLVRSSFMSLRSQEFVEASRALGASNVRLMMGHMLPNSLAPIIVAATLLFGQFIVLESTLSFLGLGIRLPTASWGNMLTSFTTYMWIAPEVAVYPGAMIFLTVLSLNFMGDGLRDALDPRLKL
jgi:peptide/nickel transport system permease protein